MWKRHRCMYKGRGQNGLLRTIVKLFGVPVCFQVLLLTVITLVCVQASTDPSSFACTTYNSTVIRLDWSVATDVSISGYYLYLTRTDGLKTQDGPGITLPARNYISYTFYGLGYYAQYDISINSYDSSGTNYTVYTQTCTTSSDAPDLSNFNLTCEGISFYEISCTWGSVDAVYWNGVPYGWQLGYISYYNDVYTYVNFNTTATLAYTIQNLQFDTKYLINIRSVNTGGFYGPYSSTNSKTLGWPSNAVCDSINESCESCANGLKMLLMICCCQCCCKGQNKSNNTTEINIFNEENNEYYGNDDDDDDYDESEEEEEEEYDEENDEEEYEDISDGNESPLKGTALPKKKKISDDENDEPVAESDEEESEEEEDSETDEEIYVGLTEDEKKAKKEERAKEKAKKKADKKTKREEEKKRKEEERKEKIRQRMKKRNAAMAGAATLKTVDETKKEKKTEPKEKKEKKIPDSSDDDESEGYYEDWNPDADENPDVAVNRVSVKDDKNSEKDNKKSGSDKKSKDKKQKDKEKQDKKAKSDKKKKQKGASNDSDDGESDDDEYDDEDYDDEDDDDEYSSEDDVKNTNRKTKAKTSKDSGRGSASSNASLWGDDTNNGKSDGKTEKSKSEKKEEPKKKGGFLSKLFGTTSSKPQGGKGEMADNKLSNNKPIKDTNNINYGDWGDDDNLAATQTSNNNIAGYNTHITSNSKDQFGNPIIVNAPTLAINTNPYSNSDSYGYNAIEERAPHGYERNPNGTFRPLRGNFNANVPPGFVRNSDGSIQRGGNTTKIDNNPPPGYAKNFDGTFYPVRGNTNPVVPHGFTRNHDGTIFRNPQTVQNNMSNTAPPGFGKNPDGTFYPLPGNNNPVIPPGFSRNHDGTIYRTSNQASENYQSNFNAGGSFNQNSFSGNQHPPGYIKNPDGTFYPAPGNRNPIVPAGFSRNPDGSIYRIPGTNSANLPNQAPPGYGTNMDGTFYPLPENRNPVVPPGFTQNPNGTIRQTTQPPVTDYANTAPPPGYSKNPDGSFQPHASNRNSLVPQGYVKNPDGSIYFDPYHNKASSSNAPPPGYGTKADGSFYPLPSNRNPVVPSGYTKRPDGSIIEKSNQLNSQHLSNSFNDNAPPQGFVPNPDGSFRPLPGNRNPIVPAGFIKNPDGSISNRKSNHTNASFGNNDNPAGYAKNPDGTFRPLPGNRNPTVPPGFTKNPDGTIRRNRNNPTTFSNDIPAGYGKNPDGTFYPLSSNHNPVVPRGYRKNPDGTISKLPEFRNNLSQNVPAARGHANTNDNATSQSYKRHQNTKRPYPYGPADLDPPAIPDDRDKFNDLFAADAKRKALLKKVNSKGKNNPPGFTGDGEDIFAPQSSQEDSGNSGTSYGQSLSTHPSFGGSIPQTSNNHGKNADGNNMGSGNLPLRNNVFGNTNQNGKNAAQVGVNGGQNHNPPGSFSGGHIPDPSGSSIPNSYQSGAGNTTNANDRLSDGTNKRPPFSIGNGNGNEIVLSNRKPISFRENDPRYNDYKQENMPDSDKPMNHPKQKRNSFQNISDDHDPNHDDTFDTEVLPANRPTSKKKPIARFRGANKAPAWDSKKPDNEKTDKSGKKTPVTELLPRQERQELIEPEPVLGSDRLANKFPFLNVNKKNEPNSGNTENSKGAGDSESRRKSDPELVLRGREKVDKKDLPKRDFPPLPNTLTGEAGAIAQSNDLAGLKPETRDQIFYGFGVGRWRVVAAKWLNKWKMKKKPVKTAKSSWD